MQVFPLLVCWERKMHVFSLLACWKKKWFFLSPCMVFWGDRVWEEVSEDSVVRPAALTFSSLGQCGTQPFSMLFDFQLIVIKVLITKIFNLFFIRETLRSMCSIEKWNVWKDNIPAGWTRSWERPTRRDPRSQAWREIPRAHTMSAFAASTTDISFLEV